MMEDLERALVVLLYMSTAIILVPQTAAATWRVLWALVCLLFSLCYVFHGSLSYSVYKKWCLCYTWYLVYYRVPARSFSSVGHLACGGRAGGVRQIVSSSSFFFSNDSSFYLFDCFISFLRFIECVWRACCIYL